MTEEEIKNIIADNLGLKDLPGLALANDYFNAAVEHLAALDWVWWNKKATTFDTVSGTQSYLMGQDIFTDYPDILGVQQIWRTDKVGVQIPILTPLRYNAYARGSTTSGIPKITTVHSNDKTLEIYYKPDAVYTLWAYIRLPLKFTDIPSAFNKVVIWQAVMIGADPKSGLFEKAASMMAICQEEIANKGLNKWDGDKMTPEFIMGSGIEYTKTPNTDDFYAL